MATEALSSRDRANRGRELLKSTLADLAELSAKSKAAAAMAAQSALGDAVDPPEITDLHATRAQLEARRDGLIEEIVSAERADLAARVDEAAAAMEDLERQAPDRKAQFEGESDVFDAAKKRYDDAKSSYEGFQKQVNHSQLQLRNARQVLHEHGVNEETQRARLMQGLPWG